MHLRCEHCTKTLAIAADGALPASCPHCAQRPTPARLGAYEPLRLLAAGGMGEVYLARHRELGTEVAIKLLPALPADQLSAVRERFAREARLTAQVAHAGVVQVLASDLAGDRPFLVLELVRGRTLRQCLQDGPLPWTEALQIGAATADVLAAAHAHGVLHRDIKPDNVMREPDGAVRVLDFGIARAVQDDAPITRTGEIVGTPEYMAPEQLLDGPEAVDARTDVHALGVLVYELLTGHSPFRGANLFQSLKLVEALVPPKPSQRQPAVPASVDAAVLRALEKQPSDRFASAAAFAQALRTALPRPTPTTRSSPWPLALATLAVVLVGGALGFAYVLDRLGQDLVELGERGEGPFRELALQRASAELYDAGRWCEALATAERIDSSHGHDAARCRSAFALHHLAWPLAAGLPAWVGYVDARQRRALFGDALEPAANDDEDTARWRELLDGRVPASSPAVSLDADTALLTHALAGTARPEPHTRSPLDRLLSLRELPHADRCDGFAAFAQPLPLASAEHWLAQLLARHRRGDAQGGSQAAEMAWLSGAGELAVVLDAALQLLPFDGEPTLHTLPRATAQRLFARLSTADRDDAPVSVLLQVLVVTSQGEPADTRPLRTLPLGLRRQAAPWCVRAAAATPNRRDPLLLVAASLGAAPDWTTAPWRDVPADQRSALEQEAARGR